MITNLFKFVIKSNSIIHLSGKVYKHKCSLYELVHRRIVTQSVRCVASINETIKPENNSLDTEKKEENEFITIYANPTVKYLALINKAVWFPTVGVIGLYPVTLLLFAAGFMTSHTLINTLLITTHTCCVIHVVALNVWRKVGFLYVNKDMTQLKVGYVSYWGNRDDVILPVSKVMLLSDLHRTPFDYIYRKVKTFDAKLFEFYKLDRCSDYIVKRDLFAKIFGSNEL